MYFSGLRRLSRYGDGELSREVLAGERAGVLLDLVGRALGDDLAAVDAGAGPHVDDAVRHADRLFVVLHDEHGVPQVAEPDQRVQEPAVVALVQADGGLVEDVQHAHEGRADLGGEPDALAFAAGEGGRAAVQRQVVESHVHHEPEALADLLQDALRDGRFLLGERQVREELQRPLHAHLRDVVDVQPRHLDRERFLPEPAPVAVRAGLVVHVLLHLPLGDEGVGLVVPPLEIGDDPLEGLAGVPGGCSREERPVRLPRRCRRAAP